MALVAVSDGVVELVVERLHAACATYLPAPYKEDWSRQDFIE
jgi:hypothetical protein